MLDKLRFYKNQVINKTYTLYKSTITRITSGYHKNILTFKSLFQKNKPSTKTKTSETVVDNLTVVQEPVVTTVTKAPLIQNKINVDSQIVSKEISEIIHPSIHNANSSIKDTTYYKDKLSLMKINEKHITFFSDVRSFLNMFEFTLQNEGFIYSSKFYDVFCTHIVSYEKKLREYPTKDSTKEVVTEINNLKERLYKQKLAFQTVYTQKKTSQALQEDLEQQTNKLLLENKKLYTSKKTLELENEKYSSKFDDLQKNTRLEKEEYRVAIAELGALRGFKKDADQQGALIVTQYEELEALKKKQTILQADLNAATEKIKKYKIFCRKFSEDMCQITDGYKELTYKYEQIQTQNHLYQVHIVTENKLLLDKIQKPSEFTIVQAEFNYNVSTMAYQALRECVAMMIMFKETQKTVVELRAHDVKLTQELRDSQHRVSIAENDRMCNDTKETMMAVYKEQAYMDAKSQEVILNLNKTVHYTIQCKSLSDAILTSNDRYYSTLKLLDNYMKQANEQKEQLILNQLIPPQVKPHYSYNNKQIPAEPGKNINTVQSVFPRLLNNVKTSVNTSEKIIESKIPKSFQKFVSTGFTPIEQNLNTKIKLLTLQEQKPLTTLTNDVVTTIP